MSGGIRSHRKFECERTKERKKERHRTAVQCSQSVNQCRKRKEMTHKAGTGERGREQASDRACMVLLCFDFSPHSASVCDTPACRRFFFPPPTAKHVTSVTLKSTCIRP